MHSRYRKENASNGQSIQHTNTEAEEEEGGRGLAATIERESGCKGYIKDGAGRLGRTERDSGNATAHVVIAYRCALVWCGTPMRGCGDLRCAQSWLRLNLTTPKVELIDDIFGDVL